MRALTVRQPWAWAIVHGGKDVENRSRNLAGSYRGPVAIHAAARYADDWADAAAVVEEITGHAIPPFDCGHKSEVLGAIVGVVGLVSVHHGSDHGRGYPCSPWAMADQWHLVMANPRPLATPIPCRGALGLWTPSAAVLDQLQEVANR